MQFNESFDVSRSFRPIWKTFWCFLKYCYITLPLYDCLYVPKTLKTEKFSRNLINRDIRIYEIMIELQINIPSVAQPTRYCSFWFSYLNTHNNIISLVIKYFLFEIWLAHWITNSYFLFDMMFQLQLSFVLISCT